MTRWAIIITLFLLAAVQIPGILEGSTEASFAAGWLCAIATYMLGDLLGL